MSVIDAMMDRRLHCSFGALRRLMQRVAYSCELSWWSSKGWLGQRAIGRGKKNLVQDCRRRACLSQVACPGFRETGTAEVESSARRNANANANANGLSAGSVIVTCELRHRANDASVSQGQLLSVLPPQCLERAAPVPWGWPRGGDVHCPPRWTPGPGAANGYGSEARRDSRARERRVWSHGKGEETVRLYVSPVVSGTNFIRCRT